MDERDSLRRGSVFASRRASSAGSGRSGLVVVILAGLRLLGPFLFCASSLSPTHKHSDGRKDTLQIKLIGSKSLPAAGSQPRKSLVRKVPQPALNRMRRPGVHFWRSRKSAALRKSFIVVRTAVRLVAPLASAPPK